jgi:hypothetical protein
MPVYSCPKGHESSEPDFCSECGTKIQGAPPAQTPGIPVSAPVGAGAPCPDCGAPRADTSSNFCEICGYNFSTQAHGNVPEEEEEVEAPAPPEPAAAPAPPPAPPEPVSPPVPSPAAPVMAAPVVAAPIVAAPVVAAPEPVKQWTLVAAVDPSLREADSPEPPANVAPITIKLDKPVSLIGRKSEKRAIIPEVSLDLDDAVSHRHALLTRSDDGSLTLRDIGSANGTRLNGADVKPMVDMLVHDGDQITLGRWTRLSLKSV